jgi:hypothetical protein
MYVNLLNILIYKSVNKHNNIFIVVFIDGLID